MEQFVQEIMELLYDLGFNYNLNAELNMQTGFLSELHLRPTLLVERQKYLVPTWCRNLTNYIIPLYHKYINVKLVDLLLASLI